MTTFYLQTKTNPDFVQGRLDNRKFIDTKVDKNCDELESCEANSWIEAKQLFGLPLTYIQQNILD